MESMLEKGGANFKNYEKCNNIVDTVSLRSSLGSNKAQNKECAIFPVTMVAANVVSNKYIILS